MEVRRLRRDNGRSDFCAFARVSGCAAPVRAQCAFERRMLNGAGTYSVRRRRWTQAVDAKSEVAGAAAKVYVSFRMIRLEVEAFERHKGINLVRRGAAKS